MVHINHLFAITLLSYGLLHGAAFPRKETADARKPNYRIVTTAVPGTATSTWSENTGQIRRSIEDIEQAVILIHKESLPPHRHKVITSASQPRQAQYLLLAMKDTTTRDALLESINSHSHHQLTLKKVYEQFGTGVDSLKALSFFVALFTFGIYPCRNKNPTAYWLLEMGNETCMTTHPISSADAGFSRVYVSDPSIFLVDLRTLALKNVYKEPHIAALINIHTEGAKKIRADAVRALVETPDQPFGFKINTNLVKSYLMPTYGAPVINTPQDDCNIL